MGKSLPKAETWGPFLEEENSTGPAWTMSQAFDWSGAGCFPTILDDKKQITSLISLILFDAHGRGRMNTFIQKILNVQHVPGSRRYSGALLRHKTVHTSGSQLG